MIDLFLFFLIIFICFPLSNFFSALGLLIAWEVLPCGAVTCLNKGGAFSFSYISPSEICFDLLSWDFFWVGMMISRTGWISVGVLCDCIFPMGRKRLFFFLFERKSDL